MNLQFSKFRPVALTSFVIKVSIGEIIKALVLKATNSCLDPMQFAHQSKWHADDAKLWTLLKHRENPQAHAQLLFADLIILQHLSTTYPS